MTPRVRIFTCALLALCGSFSLISFGERAQANAKTDAYWQVDDVRPGMKGVGRTVIKGTKIESFHAEIIGVLRNVNPGRDMVLARLSGANLEKTGVIAGMSGSPVYINDKLLGAVAYAWPFGKEPIAGITPFVQMHEFVASYEKRDLANKGKARGIGLGRPLHIDGKTFDRVTVAQDFNDPLPTAADGLWMVPLRTPLVVTGMSATSLAAMKDTFNQHGLVPIQGGGVGGNIPEEERNVPLLPGGALVAAMITGDFDLSGIGTTTHVEGKRVYGWGHPFMTLGSCEFPLMTGYVHVIVPRQTISFKMGSPLKTVGVINADVTTAIAGWLDRQPDMIPVSAQVLREGGLSKTFNVKMVRQRALMPMLLQTILTNSIDLEGDLPDEMTALMKVRIGFEGREPLVLSDMYSGPNFAGQRAPQALFAPLTMLLAQLNANPFANVRIDRIDCTTEVLPGRRTAEIDGIELESDTYAPGDIVKAHVFLRTYKGSRQRVTVALPLPSDLPEGPYTASVADDLASARQDLRDNPLLGNPQTIDQLFQSLELITGAKRTTLTVRLAVPGTGVAVDGKALPNLPGSMVQILAGGRRTGAQQINSAIVVRHPTDWVIQGSDSLKFTVAKNKKTLP